MASTLTDVFSGSLKTVLLWTRTDTQEVGTVANRGSVSATYRIGEGSGSQQADLVFNDTRSIPANQVESIDLLSLTNSELGVSVPYTFRQVRLVRVVNNETATGKKLLFGVGSGGTTSYAHNVGPGSEFVTINHKDPWIVTSGNSVIRIANPNGSAISYTMTIFGTSVEAA